MFVAASVLLGAVLIAPSVASAGERVGDAALGARCPVRWWAARSARWQAA
jgi:hypothetical protein